MFLYVLAFKGLFFLIIMLPFVILFIITQILNMIINVKVTRIIKKFFQRAVFLNVPLVYGHLVMLDLMIAGLMTFRNTDRYDAWTPVVFASKYADTVVSGILACIFFIIMFVIMVILFIQMAWHWKSVKRVHGAFEFFKTDVKEK